MSLFPPQDLQQKHNGLLTGSRYGFLGVKHAPAFIAVTEANKK